MRRVLRNEFTLEDYRQQLAQVRKMGPLQQVLSMIPGLGNMAKDVDVALHQIVEKEGGLSPESAAAYVEGLRKEKRYKRDVY